MDEKAKKAQKAEKDDGPAKADRPQTENATRKLVVLRDMQKRIDLKLLEVENIKAHLKGAKEDCDLLMTQLGNEIRGEPLFDAEPEVKPDEDGAL